jgi:uncharacterized protein
MILIDTGPSVALFDRHDGLHARTSAALKGLREPLAMTVAVLTETFHVLEPQSVGSDRVREFVMRGGLAVAFLDRPSLVRAFELMEQYADHPMDLADASLLWRNHWRLARYLYWTKKRLGRLPHPPGHRHYAVEIIR